jgi:hypothetical protein
MISWTNSMIPSYAFVILAHVAPPADHDTDMQQWLDQTVPNAGLGSLAEFSRKSLEFKAEMSSDVLDGALGQQVSDLLRRGEVIASRCGVFPEPLNAQLAKLGYAAPLVLLSDLGLFSFSREVDVDRRNQFLQNLTRRMDLI